MNRLIVFLTFTTGAALAQEPRFIAWSNSIAQNQLSARATLISSIQSTNDAESRKAHVLSTIMNEIGGLPTYAGPLNAQLMGQINQSGFRIELVEFESMPGIRVSANVYVPSAAGPFPAILFQIGHYSNSKAAEQLTASNLALNGFLVLTFDPIGQGERLQGYNPNTGQSIVPPGTSQHLMAGTQSVLVGQSYARYEIFDAKRALDYLVSRPDVDSSRIGATGCSGGGTLTTYISALDSRIQATAPACYINSFQVGFPGPIGDSEQSPPSFIADGLDESDYVELFAPRPFLILLTQGDYFTPQGGQIVYDEAKKWYGLYGASDKLQFFVGPGPHGTPIEVRQKIYGWMIQWLKNGVGDATEQAVNLVPDSALNVTPGGWVGGSDIYQVIRSAPRSPGAFNDLMSLLSQIIQYAPQYSSANPGPPVDAGTYIRQPFQYSPESGLTLDAQFLVPKAAGIKPAAVVVTADALGSPAAISAVQGGSVVLEVLPRGLPDSSAGDFTNDWTPATRAWFIGRNLPGTRAKDILQALDLLAARPDVDAKNITGIASGVPGLWLLLAAALDSRISSLSLDRTPYSFQPAMDVPAHYDLHSAAIPGFFLKFDIANLVSALGRRTIVWTNPTDWMHNVVSQSAINPRLTAAVTGKGTVNGQYYVDLQVTNSGPGAALGTSINALSFRTLAGSGTVTAASSLPVAIGDLAAGSSVTVRLFLNVPASVTRFSIAESGSLHNGTGTALTFSLSQAVTK